MLDIEDVLILIATLTMIHFNSTWNPLSKPKPRYSCNLGFQVVVTPSSVENNLKFFTAMFNTFSNTCDEKAHFLFSLNVRTQRILEVIFKTF